MSDDFVQDYEFTDNFEQIYYFGVSVFIADFRREITFWDAPFMCGKINFKRAGSLNIHRVGSVF